MKLDLPDWGWQYFFCWNTPNWITDYIFFSSWGVFFFFACLQEHFIWGEQDIHWCQHRDLFWSSHDQLRSENEEHTPLRVGIQMQKWLGAWGSFLSYILSCPRIMQHLITLKWEIWNCRSRWSPLVQGKKLFLLPNTYTAGSWWLEHDFYFPIWLGNVIIPIDELKYFSEG